MLYRTMEKNVVILKMEIDRDNSVCVKYSNSKFPMTQGKLTTADYILYLKCTLVSTGIEMYWMKNENLKS